MNEHERANEEHYSGKIVELCKANDPAEASAIQSRLEETGIEAEVVGGMSGNAFDLPMNLSALAVWVREGDLGRARGLLEEIREMGGEEE